MIFVKPNYEFNELPSKKSLKLIEKIGRTCYKSEDKITEDSYEKFVKRLIDHKHESVLEHSMISVHIVTSRGVTHELVRHRLASYSQESTRYCRYDKDHVKYIIPEWCNEIKEGVYDDVHSFGYVTDEAQYYFLTMCLQNEYDYCFLLDKGWTAEKAREILPNCLKTEIHMTTNIREWRHALKLRCHPTAHPNMREIMRMILPDLQSKVPIVFDDITY